MEILDAEQALERSLPQLYQYKKELEAIIKEQADSNNPKSQIDIETENYYQDILRAYWFKKEECIRWLYEKVESEVRLQGLQELKKAINVLEQQLSEKNNASDNMLKDHFTQEDIDFVNQKVKKTENSTVTKRAVDLTIALFTVEALKTIREKLDASLVMYERHIQEKKDEIKEKETSGYHTFSPVKKKMIKVSYKNKALLPEFIFDKKEITTINETKLKEYALQNPNDENLIVQIKEHYIKTT